MNAEEMEARLEELRRINRVLHLEILTERQRRQRVADEAQAIILEYSERIESLGALVATLQGGEE